MKKLLPILCVVLLATALVLAGCGGGGSDPKSLAKQTYSEFQKAVKEAGEEESALAYIGWALKMSMEPTPAFNKLAEKVENLSDADQKIYEAEMAKLLGLEGLW